MSTLNDSSSSLVSDVAGSEALLRRSQRVVESQNAALQLIINSAPLEEVFDRLIAAAEAESGDEAVGCVLLVDPVNGCLRRGAAPGLPAEYQCAIDGIPVDATVGTCAAAAARREVVITTDIASDPGWQSFRHLPLGLGLVAAWSMPIVSADGTVLGTFGNYFRRRRGPTETEIRTVGMLARTAAVAIERHQREDRLLAATRETARQHRLYETILSTTPDLVYVFNLQHRFTYANNALLRMWGRTWSEAIGRNCLELGYEPWHAEMHDREIEQVVATRAPIRGVVAFNGTNGRRYYDYIFAPVLGAGGEVEAIAGTTRDVTEQRHAAGTARFLADLSQQLAVMTDESEIIRYTVAALGRHVGAHRCYFVECLESENRVSISENWVRDAAGSLAGTLSLFDFGGAAWWREYARGDFAVADTESHPLIDRAAAANYAALGLRSYAVQPIKRTGEWTTVLAITDNVPRQWTRDELHLLETVAARVWPLVERARTENALREARDTALAASRAKDDFLAALSHELRTPLNPVLLLATEAAANASLPETVRADFEAIARNVRLEARLIDDLLDLTRVAHNKLALSFGSHDTHGLLRQAIDGVQPDLREKKLHLVTRLDAPATQVLADDARLQQIFWNLLKNAVKFTPEGGTITVTTRLTEQSPPALAVAIADTGIGLTARELTSIFNPFSQGEHSQAGTPSRFGGLGLGLAISRTIADLHHGSLVAESEGRNRGATFTVTLPLAHAAPPRAPAPDATGQSVEAVARQQRFRRVLLVEDHEPSRRALARLLANRGMAVAQAGTASEALNRAGAETFDLIISDIGLPDTSGYDLMTILQTRHGCRGIALSGYGTEADIARSREAGFMAHLVKPISAQALDRVIEELGRN